MTNTLKSICHINLSRGYRGGERQTELLIRELARKGYAQRLVARAGEPLTRCLRDVEGLDIVQASRPFFKCVPELRAGVVHAHEARAAKLAYAAFRLYSTPYLVTRRLTKRPGSNAITRAAYRRAGALVAIGESVAVTLRDYTGRDDVAVIHSTTTQQPVDVRAREALRARWPDRYLVVNVAALVHSDKGQRHLIRVARRLQTARPDIQFILLGEGRDRAWLESEAGDLTNIRFEGFVENPGDYLAAAQLFVLPSLKEALGGACLDALDSGLPVIASAVGGIPEIITHNMNGLLVPPADEDALFAAICRVRDEPGLATALAEGGRATAAAHHPEPMAAAYARVYAALNCKLRT